MSISIDRLDQRSRVGASERWQRLCRAMHAPEENGVEVTPVALSLNASFQYIGFSVGAALGSMTLSMASPLALGCRRRPSLSRSFSLAVHFRLE